MTRLLNYLAVAFGCAFAAAPATAQFETRSYSATDLVPLNVVTADFNHDGRMDLAVASGGVGTSEYPSEVQVFLGRGDGTFAAPTTYDAGLGQGPLAVADVNQDGNPDLIVINSACPNDVCDDSVAVLPGNGDGTFQPLVNYSTPPRPAGLVIGDFNGDGKLDIATINQSDYTSTCDCVGVLLGNGDGTFQEPAIVTSLEAYPFAVAAGHFGPGKNLDLVVTTNAISSGGVQILLGNGDGTFSLGKTYTVAPEPESVVTASFRHDGKTDIAVGEFEGRGVAVLLGNGDGTFQQPVVYVAGTPLGVAAGDVNGDGNVDLVAVGPENANSGVTYVLLGNGNGTFRKAVTYPTGEFPGSVAIADFNGDHMPDITVTDQLGSQQFVLLNTGVVSL